MSSKISGRIGVPTLFVFIVLGMLFGSDGVIKIAFDNYEIAEQICSVALIFIMFYGGFGTRWSEARPVAGKSVLLSSVGVVLTAVLTGLFCVPELSWTEFGGLFYTGDPALLGAQVLGILVTVVFVGVLDVVLGFVVKACFKGSLRVSEAEEAQGLDVAAHGESAYPAYVGLD